MNNRITTKRVATLAAMVVYCWSAAVVATRASAQTADPMNMGSRLELFVDDSFVDRFEGDAALHLHQPRGKEVVLMNDQPWEDTTMGYFSVLKDGETFRMYYRGHHHGGGDQARGEPMCYAESRDGIRWVKPKLGLFTFEGSADNNIVLGGDGRKYIPTERWRGDLGFETGLGRRARPLHCLCARPAPREHSRRAHGRV